MDDILVIKNLNFKYGEKTIFQNFNLRIKRGSWTTVVGHNGSGKSTLIKIIVGLIKNDDYILIDNVLKTKDNLKEIRQLVNVVMENPNSTFVAETVFDEIAFALENLELDCDTITKRVIDVAECLKIKMLLDLNPYSLSNGQKQLVALASILVLKPKIIIFDESFKRLDYLSYCNILNILVKLQQDYQITIINITHNLEETLYGDQVVIIADGKVILNDRKEVVFKEEKVFNDLNLELPFIVSLSSKLIYYDLIKEIMFDVDLLVNKLWK